MAAGPSRSELWLWRAAWLGIAIGSGVVVGVVSGALQQAGSSLLVLQPVALGALLGVTLLGAASLTARRPQWWAAVLAALVAIAGQHIWLYRAELIARQRAVEEQAMVELFKPGWSREGFCSYFIDYGQRPNGAAWVGGELPNAVVWGIDACLLLAATVAIVEWYRRRHAGRSPSSPDEGA